MKMLTKTALNSILLIMLFSSMASEAYSKERKRGKGKGNLSSRDFEAKTFKGMPYQLQPPIDFKENPGKRYPVVVWLHGAGGNGTKSLKAHGGMAKGNYREKHPCYVIVPQARNSYTEWRVSGKGALLGKVFAIIDEMIKDKKVDENRIYFAGYSNGGHGVWAAVAAKPKRIAGAIAIAGRPGHLGRPLDAKTIKDVPIWAFHGAKDGIVEPNRVRQLFKKMKEVKGNMKYTEAADEKHSPGYAFAFGGDKKEKGIVTQYASDGCDKTDNIWEWLFAQKR